MSRVFLDYAAITPIDPRVAKEMEKAQKYWANPSSLHQEGEIAKKVLEEARIKIARILHCKASEIFFTSGGTESLNLAIFGVVYKYKKSNSEIPHIITSTIEHPAVLEPIKHLLKNKEVEVSFISPNEKGIISPESIKKEIKENTVLVVIQHANNEIGVIQPIRKIKEVIGKVYLLVDACQSVLYENISLESLGADLLILDGLKMYGPRGAGILAVRHSVPIESIVFGGGQESGLRSGTENVPAAVGLGKALEIAVQKREAENSRLIKLRDYTIAKILNEIPNSSLNGDFKSRLPNNINVCLDGADSEFLVIKLDTLGFAVSAASACHSLISPPTREAVGEPTGSVGFENGSYVIESLGNKNCGSSSLRITLGRSTKKSDLDKFISALKKIVHR